jgi:hypothetical protein
MCPLHLVSVHGVEVQMYDKATIDTLPIQEYAEGK